MLTKHFNTAFLSLSAIALIGGFLFWQNEADEEIEEDDHHHELIALTEEQRQEAEIELAIAEAGNLQKKLQIPGKIILNEDFVVHIFPKVEGVVKEAKKNLGDNVKAGEILAILESREMADAKAAYLIAIQKEAQAAYLYQQEKNLIEKNISSNQEYQAAAMAYNEALLNLELTKQKLHALGLSEQDLNETSRFGYDDLRTLNIKAPFDGTILSRHVTTGEYIKTDQELYTVGNLETLWVDLNLYQQDFSHVNLGQIVEISDAEGRQSDGQILHLSPVVDEETRRIRAIASLDNSSRDWYPGSYITAHVAAAAVPVELLITKEAVQKIDGEDCAFIQTPEGFEVRPIKLGRSDGQYWEVLSGVEPNESYAATNTFLLKADHGKDEAEHMD